MRKSFLFAFAALCASATTVGAQEFPNRPITLTIPFAAGDGLDMSARVLAEQIREEIGQPLIVTNRAGGSGYIAAEAVVRAQPNGYNLLYGTAAMMTITPYLRAAPYDPAADFVPIAKVFSLTLLIAVNPGLQVANWADLVSYAKQNPGKVSFASSGDGTLLHITGERLQRLGNFQMLHVPFRGMAQAITELMENQINLVFEPSVVPQVQAGRARAMAILADRRLPVLPTVPTLSEQGQSWDQDAWFGIFAPKGTPPEVVGKLTTAVSKALQAPEFAQRLPPGAYVNYRDSRDFAAAIAREQTSNQQLIKSLNIKLD